MFLNIYGFAVPFLLFYFSNCSFFILLHFRTSEDSDGMDCLDSDEDDHVDRKPERYVYFHGECVKANQKKERKKE